MVGRWLGILLGSALYVFLPPLVAAVIQVIALLVGVALNYNRFLVGLGLGIHGYLTALILFFLLLEGLPPGPSPKGRVNRSKPLP